MGKTVVVFWKRKHSTQILSMKYTSQCDSLAREQSASNPSSSSFSFEQNIFREQKYVTYSNTKYSYTVFLLLFTPLREQFSLK